MQLAKSIGAVHLSSDHIRKKMFGGDPKKFPKHEGDPMVFAALDYVKYEILLSGNSVVYDSNANRKRIRDEAREFAKAFDIKPVLIWVRVPLDVAIKRATSRDEDDYRRKTPKHKVIAHHEKLEEPLEDEPHIELDGTQPFESQLASLNEQLKLLVKD